MISTIGDIFRRYLSPGALTVRLTDRSHEALDVGQVDGLNEAKRLND